MPDTIVERSRPQSPNIQIYRPQLTSVLSIANRISGVILSIAGIGLVVWLVAVAAGPQAYAAVQGLLASTTGQIALFAATFAFFLHLCGGIRHLAWDAGYGFELWAIYASGWAVVMASVVLTMTVWIAARFVAG
jgi:succinate dehydrogenase / fumarate reductase, cytochrome b subunit